MSLNLTRIIVIRGLDPQVGFIRLAHLNCRTRVNPSSVVHLFRKKLDCRVKPGNDEHGECKRKLL
jgi:hypothetical protein